MKIITMKNCLLAAAFCMIAGMAFAQNNSTQATQAAQKHQAEKAGAASPAKAKDAPKAANVAKGSVATRLAACKNTAGWNVIKREQCVWDLCKGRWGKEGCPAQASNRPVDR
jgi:hypothetical protein